MEHCECFTCIPALLQVLIYLILFGFLVIVTSLAVAELMSWFK